MKEELILTEDWDKTFPKSDKVNHHKVTFHNRYGITLAADMYEPKEIQGRLSVFRFLFLSLSHVVIVYIGIVYIIISIV